MRGDAWCNGTATAVVSSSSATNWQRARKPGIGGGEADSRLSRRGRWWLAWVCYNDEGRSKGMCFCQLSTRRGVLAKELCTVPAVTRCQVPAASSQQPAVSSQQSATSNQQPAPMPPNCSGRPNSRHLERGRAGRRVGWNSSRLGWVGWWTGFGPSPAPCSMAARCVGPRRS